MHDMKNILAGLVLALVLFISSASTVHAAGLTHIQIHAVLGLLAAFGVEGQIIENVRIALVGTNAPVVQDSPVAPQNTVPQEAPIAPVSIPTSQNIPQSTKSPKPARLRVTPTEHSIAGSNCSAAVFKVTVYDRHGSELREADVTVSAPSRTETLKSPAEFSYKTPAANVIETLLFSSETATTSAAVYVGSGLNESKITQWSNDRWYEKTGGALVDPVRMLCI